MSWKQCHILDVKQLPVMHSLSPLIHQNLEGEKKITIFDSKEANQSRKLGLSCEDENQFKGT